jgi:phosphoglycerate dehydrogenase-like enzyme
MTDINIIITRSLEKEFLEQIAGVNPNIRIMNGVDLFTAEENGDFSAKDKFDAMLAQAEIICGYWPPKNVTHRAPKLKWMHTLLAGADRPEYAELLKNQVIVSNSTGIHGTQISELVLMLMLNLAKQAHFYFKMQQEKKWAPNVPGILEGKTLGIVGLGNIGKAVARMGQAIGMRVIAIRRSVTAITQDKNVDVLMPAGYLRQLLSESDFVVIALPATAETNKIIGEKELRAMKPSAYLINIARGKIIDEQALIRAIKEHWIAGAGLDTVTSEPLSPQSEMWELPGVIITPHISGRREDYNKLAIPLFCENLKCYLSREKMLNVIDKEKGY